MIVFGILLVKIFATTRFRFTNRQTFNCPQEEKPTCSVDDMQTSSLHFGRPGTSGAAAGLRFWLRAAVSAAKYGDRAPERSSTPEVERYSFPTMAP